MKRNLIYTRTKMQFTERVEMNSHLLNLRRNGLTKSETNTLTILKKRYICRPSGLILWASEIAKDT